MAEPTRHITLSHKDKQSLVNLRNHQKVRQLRQPGSYQDKAVIKPWGHEFLIFENECVAIWFLNIKKDHSTSMHCHPLKKTALAVLSGKVLCNTFRHRNFLATGESIIIEPSVFHCTKALSLEGTYLLEIETPPDKLDLVRLEDDYGRESWGYEGCDQMATENLKNFRHFYFDERNCHQTRHTVENCFSISMELFRSQEDFRTNFAVNPSSIYVVCRGALLGPDGSIAADVGEVESGRYLQQLEEIGIDTNTVLMSVGFLDSPIEGKR
jgi:mannose-6-phosphate isomerase-like protein (cupin superfamily)